MLSGIKDIYFIPNLSSKQLSETYLEMKMPALKDKDVFIAILERRRKIISMYLVKLLVDITNHYLVKLLIMIINHTLIHPGATAKETLLYGFYTLIFILL